MKKLFMLSVILMSMALLPIHASADGPSISKSTQAEIAGDARRALQELYATRPEAKELRSRATAILIFPDILKAGLIIGGSGGNGVLFSPDERVLGYYNVASLSYGLQAGAQNYSEAMFLMTRDALSYLNASSGWSVGAGPSVTVVDEGMAKDFSTTTLRSDVYAFIYGQHGLMAGIGVQGQKITKLRALP